MSRPRSRPRLYVYVPRDTAVFVLVYSAKCRSWVQFSNGDRSLKTFPPGQHERRITHLFYTLRWQHRVDTDDAYTKWGIEL